MRKLVLRFVCLVSIAAAWGCKSKLKETAGAAKNSVSILGLWKVQRYTIAMYSMNDNELLKGPFREDAQGDSLVFSADSIYGSDQQYKARTWYTYSRANDSVLQVRNTESGDSMTFLIHYLGKDSLYFTNIRPRKDRGDRYEVQIYCKRN